MGDVGRDVSDGERRTHPILAGALVGLLVGSIGIIASMALNGTPIGGFTGAISCGITAVYLSPPDVQERLLNVVIANIVSTIVFASSSSPPTSRTSGRQKGSRWRTQPCSRTSIWCSASWAWRYRSASSRLASPCLPESSRHVSWIKHVIPRRPVDVLDGRRQWNPPIGPVALPASHSG